MKEVNASRDKICPKTYRVNQIDRGVIGNVGNGPVSLLGVDYVGSGMATRPRSAPADPEVRVETIDVREAFGADLPSTTSEATIRVRGNDSRFEIVVERVRTWIIEGQFRSAEVTGIIDEYGRIPNNELPQRVPDWLRRVLDHVTGVSIQEVTIHNP